MTEIWEFLFIVLFEGSKQAHVRCGSDRNNAANRRSRLQLALCTCQPQCLKYSKYPTW